MHTLTAAAIVAELRAQRNEHNIEGQRRFGITTRLEAFGVAAPVLRAVARRHRRDHALALALWAHPILDVRAVAALCDDPGKVTRGQMEAWVRTFDNWALRQIGKRSPALRRAAIAEAKRILARDTPPARWIARDALRELNRAPAVRA